MSLPPSSFAREFRAKVIPILEKSYEVQALFAALDIIDFYEGYRAVMNDAWRYHAQWLPEEHFSALEDWVMDQMNTWMLRQELKVEEHDKKFARVHADVERWNNAVLEASIIE